MNIDRPGTEPGGIWNSPQAPQREDAEAIVTDATEISVGVEAAQTAAASNASETVQLPAREKSRSPRSERLTERCPDR